MVQSYRLTHFHDLMKPNSKLETDKDFLQQFGKPMSPTMKKSDLPSTPLFANRTEKEYHRLNDIRQQFRKDVAKILWNNTSALPKHASDIERPNSSPGIQVSPETKQVSSL